MRILYPSLQRPPFVPPAGAAVPSFDWHRPFSEPVRVPRADYRAALPASGQMPWSGQQFEADNANVRWHRALSEPQRSRGYTAALAAGEIGWPFAQAFVVTETVTLDKWFVSWLTPTRRKLPAALGLFLDPINTDSPPVSGWWRPFAEPIRFLRDPRYGSALDASGERAWPYNQPAVDNANVRWHQPLAEPVRYPPRLPGVVAWSSHTPASTEVITADKWWRAFGEPVRFLRDPRYTATLMAREMPWPFAQFQNDNANVRWLVPFSEPRRDPPRQPGVVAWSSFTPASAEVITADKWWRPLGEPVRPPRRLLEASQPSLTLVVPYPLPDAQSPARWLFPLSEPQRFPREPRYRATLIASGELPWPAIAPAFDNANLRWHRPLAEPLRFKRDPRYMAVLAASGEAPWPGVQFGSDAAHVRWHRPFDEPIRYSRDPRYAAVLVASGMVLWPVTFAGPTLFPVPRQTLGNRAGRVSLVLHLAPRDSTLTNRSGRTSTVNKRLN